MDKDGKFYPLDEVNSAQLAEAWERFLKKPRRDCYCKENKASSINLSSRLLVPVYLTTCAFAAYSVILMTFIFTRSPGFVPAT